VTPLDLRGSLTNVWFFSVYSTKDPPPPLLLTDASFIFPYHGGPGRKRAETRPEHMPAVAPRSAAAGSGGRRAACAAIAAWGPCDRQPTSNKVFEFSQR
jgi:hypothetical protein